MKKTSLITVIVINIISIQLFGSANDTINQVDKGGLKQGYWTKNYENGKSMYEGYFKDDKPTGKMVRFYKSGAIRAILNYQENTGYCDVTFYYENGSKSAEGFFEGNKKDSTWRFYSYYTKTLNTVENYKNDMKNGRSYIYYPSGQIFDETDFVDGLKNGQWSQYYEDGSLKMMTYYENDQLYGCFNVFFPDGSPEIVGRYEYNLRHGNWLYYNKEGEKLIEVQYDMGKVLNEEELTSKEQEFFKQMDENIGKINEPEIEDFVGY